MTGFMWLNIWLYYLIPLAAESLGAASYLQGKHNNSSPFLSEPTSPPLDKHANNLWAACGESLDQPGAGKRDDAWKVEIRDAALDADELGNGEDNSAGDMLPTDGAARPRWV